MADPINTFDPEAQDATALGLVQKVSGDGFALTCDPKNGKHRYDVWDGDFRKVCPSIGFTREKAIAAIMKLGEDAKRAHNPAALRKVTAFGRALRPLLNASA